MNLTFTFSLACGETVEQGRNTKIIYLNKPKRFFTFSFMTKRQLNFIIHHGSLLRFFIYSFFCQKIDYFKVLYIHVYLSEKTAPSEWKDAIVIPIFKKGTKGSPGNYRPVSLTSIVCKIMEKLLKEKIVKHLSTNNLINPSQHGFTKHKSCSTN